MLQFHIFFFNKQGKDISLAIQYPTGEAQLTVPHLVPKYTIRAAAGTTAIRWKRQGKDDDFNDMSLSKPIGPGEQAQFHPCEATKALYLAYTKRDKDAIEDALEGVKLALDEKVFPFAYEVIQAKAVLKELEKETKKDHKKEKA